MFFIHGGGFKEGYGMVKGGYGPEFFMEYDVVLITVNYRLGPFGIKVNLTQNYKVLIALFKGFSLLGMVLYQEMLDLKTYNKL